MTAATRCLAGGDGRRSSSSGLAGTPTALLFLSTFLLMTIGTTVDAHGYLMSPRSRNFLAHSSQDGVGWGGTASDPKVDYEVRFFRNLVDFIRKIHGLTCSVIIHHVHSSDESPRCLL